MGTGLTVEDVNAIQDEMSKIGEDTVKSDEAKVAADAAKLAEVKATEDATKAKADDGKAKESAEKKDEEEIDVVRELKEQLRASNEMLKKLSGDYQKLNKIMVDKGLVTEDEVKESEAAAQKAKEIYTERTSKLNEMVAIMELNPNFSDVREVCSQGNFDDVIDAFSRFYVKENGGNVGEVASKMETEVWSEPNPYKKIYELVKKYHPKFAVKDDAAKAKDGEDAAKKIAADADKVKEKKAVDTNPSAASIGAGGSGAGGGGWTAAKIDALDELELSTVPKDIYDKYLLGTLK